MFYYSLDPGFRQDDELRWPCMTVPNTLSQYTAGRLSLKGRGILN